MREWLILFILFYCVGCWSASVMAIIDGRKKCKKRFGNLMIPIVVVIGILSPVLLIGSVMLSVGRFIFNGKI